MAVTSNLYETIHLYIAASTQGVNQINLATSGSFKMMLTNGYTFVNEHSAQAQITNEVTGANYVTGGINLSNVTFTIDASGTAIWDAADVDVTASATTIDADGAPIFFDGTQKPLMTFIDFGVTASAADTKVLTITWPADGIIQVKS